MELHARHWLIALLIAILLHAALALALVPLRPSPAAEPSGILLEIGSGGDGALVGGDGRPPGALSAVEPAADSPVTAMRPTGSEQATATPVSPTAVAAQTAETPMTTEQPSVTPAASDAPAPPTVARDQVKQRRAEVQPQPEAIRARAQPKPEPDPPKPAPAPARPNPKPKPSAPEASERTDAP